MLYPKFALSYSSRFVKNHLQMVQDFSRVAQSKCLLSQLKLGFWFLKWIWGFQGSNQVPYAYIHPQAPTCQVSRLTVPNSTVKSSIWYIINYRGKMVIVQSKVRIFGQHLILSPQSSFDQVLIMIPQEWLKNHQRWKSCYFWTVGKSTVIWPGHNFFMVH